MIHLEEVSPDNWRLDLHVRNDQKDFAANSITLLARAYAYRNSGSRALIIYNEDIPIGMALYYYIDGAYDFSQFFIDERYQGNGFGYEAAGYIWMPCCGNLRRWDLRQKNMKLYLFILAVVHPLFFRGTGWRN